MKKKKTLIKNFIIIDEHEWCQCISFTHSLVHICSLLWDTVQPSIMSIYGACTNNPYHLNIFPWHQPCQTRCSSHVHVLCWFCRARTSFIIGHLMFFGSVFSFSLDAIHSHLLVVCSVSSPLNVTKSALFLLIHKHTHIYINIHLYRIKSMPSFILLVGIEKIDFKYALNTHRHTHTRTKKEENIL